jgi:transcriptional antiterminator NusG
MNDEQPTSSQAEPEPEADKLPEPAAIVSPPEASTPAEGGAPPAPETPPTPATPPASATPPAPVVENKHWYVVKVQSGREETIKEAITRRVKVEGLEEYFGQIVVPVERVTEVRTVKQKGKEVTQRVTRDKKLYPGYLFVEVEYNDRILYLFRETSGVGDFVGGDSRTNRPPPPMPPKEVERIRGGTGKTSGGDQPGPAPFEKGDRVKVRDGTFVGMEGEVKDILEAKGLVRVELTIWGRPVPVELEYWQVEPTSN